MNSQFSARGKDPSETDWYNSPEYYDLIFDQDTSGEVDFLEATFRKHGFNELENNQLLTLEPACGSGRLMAELSHRGHQAHGFDLNPAMLAAAKKRLQRYGNRTHLEQAALENFAMPGLGNYDLAHCLVSSFKYILAPSAVVSHFQQVSSHLRAGGLYVIGLHLTDYTRTSCEHERWTAETDEIKVVCNTRTWPPNRRTRRERLRNRLRVNHRKETKERHLETNWECRTYSGREFLAVLSKAPQLETVGFYDFNHDIELPQPHAKLSQMRDDVVVVLRKAEA